MTGISVIENFMWNSKRHTLKDLKIMKIVPIDLGGIKTMSS